MKSSETRESEHLFTVARRQVAGKDVLYISMKVAGQVPILLEVAFLVAAAQCVVGIRTKATPFTALMKGVLDRLIK